MQDTLPHGGKPRATLGESNAGPAALFRGRFSALYLFAIFSALLIAAHAPLLRLQYFWDEAGYYVPAALDLSAGSLIPHSTPSNAHPPLVLAWLALCWKLVGFHPAVTRCAMLLLAAFSLGSLIGDPWFRHAALSALGQLLVPLLAVFVLVPAGSLFVGRDESFLSRLNRAREWRMRTAYALARVAVPRWGLSVTGIGFVLCVLGYFGAERLIEALSGLLVVGCE